MKYKDFVAQTSPVGSEVGVADIHKDKNYLTLLEVITALKLYAERGWKEVSQYNTSLYTRFSRR